MVDGHNFTFEYSWHVLAAFGMNRGRMSSRNQTTGARQWEGANRLSNASACYQHSVYDWIYMSPFEMSPFEAPGSPRASKSCSSFMPASLPPGNYESCLAASDGFTHLANSNLLSVFGDRRSSHANQANEKYDSGLFLDAAKP